MRLWSPTFFLWTASGMVQPCIRRGHSHIHKHNFSTCSHMCIYPRNMKTSIQTILFMNAHSNITHNSLKVETIQMFINTLEHLSFSCKEKWGPDKWYIMDEPQQHMLKWKKLDTKGCIFYFYKMSRIDKFIETNSRLVVTKGWGEEGIGSDCLMETELPLGKMKVFWN